MQMTFSYSLFNDTPLHECSLRGSSGLNFQEEKPCCQLAPTLRGLRFSRQQMYFQQ